VSTLLLMTERKLFCLEVLRQLTEHRLAQRAASLSLSLSTCQIGRDHLNGIEGFWSYAKHWLYMYRGVPKKFFHLYLGELSFRFNHRDEDLYPLILKLLRQITLTQISTM
jgi:ISXO2-like transposase domain